MSGKTKKTSERKFKVGQVVFSFVCIDGLRYHHLGIAKITKIHNSESIDVEVERLGGMVSPGKLDRVTVSGYYSSPLEAVEEYIKKFVNRLNCREDDSTMSKIVNYIFGKKPVPDFKPIYLNDTIERLKEIYDHYKITVVKEEKLENLKKKAISKIFKNGTNKMDNGSKMMMDALNKRANEYYTRVLVPYTEDELREKVLYDACYMGERVRPGTSEYRYLKAYIEVEFNRLAEQFGLDKCDDVFAALHLAVTNPFEKQHSVDSYMEVIRKTLGGDHAIYVSLSQRLGIE